MAAIEPVVWPGLTVTTRMRSGFSAAFSLALSALKLPLTVRATGVERRAGDRRGGQQPVDLAAGADDRDVELPAFGARAGDRRLVAVDGFGAHAGIVEAGDPAAADIVGQRGRSDRATRRRSGSPCRPGRWR